MKNIPIADYDDYIEVVTILQRKADQRNNAEANRKLQEARKLAEKYYGIGEIDTGTAILKTASDLFLLEQATKQYTQNREEII